VSTVTDPRLVPIQLDVTKPDRVAAVARELDDVQVVVNNAGVLHVGIPLSASLDTARVELETNYLSLVSMTQAFAPVLERNGGGAFVNMLSVFSWVATPLLSTYSASKAAAWSFTNAARIELRRQGTQVVGVHAGPVDTDMAASFDLEKIPPAPWQRPRSTRWRPMSQRLRPMITVARSRPGWATTRARSTPRSSVSS
jgi:short-subunit dehydrogenase